MTNIIYISSSLDSRPTILGIRERKKFRMEADFPEISPAIGTFQVYRWISRDVVWSDMKSKWLQPNRNTIERDFFNYVFYCLDGKFSTLIFTLETTHTHDILICKRSWDAYAMIATKFERDNSLWLIKLEERIFSVFSKTPRSLSRFEMFHADPWLLQTFRKIFTNWWNFAMILTEVHLIFARLMLL